MFMRLVIISLIVLIVFSQCAVKRSVVEYSDYDNLSDIERFEYEFSLSEGIKYRLLEDLPRAVYFFQRCLDIYNKSDVAYYELSNIFFSAGEIQRSVEFARKAYEINPDNKWYHYQFGMLLKEAGKPDQAIEIYKDAVSRFPGETEMKFTLAASLSMNEMYVEALSIYEELEKSLGLNERISLAREHIYMRTGNFELAHNEINRLIDAFPGEPRFYGILAELYASLGMFDEAMDSYNKLFEIDPDNGMAQLSVAEFFLRAGKETESIYYLKSAFSNPTVNFNEKIGFFSVIVENNLFSSKFDREIAELGEMLLEKHPDSDATRILLSDLYLNSAEYEMAADLLLDLYLSDTTNVIYAEQLIRIRYFTGNYSELLELGEQMMLLFPGSLIIHYFTGLACHMSGLPDQAIEIFEKALEIEGADKFLISHIYAYIGEIYNEKKDFAESDKYFNLSLEADSNNIITLNNYAYYLALREEYLEKAREFSYVTIQREPDNASFLDTYAWILYKLEQFSEAKIYIEKAFSNGGYNSFEIVKHYAAILIRLEKYEEAAKYLDMARELAEENELDQLEIYLEKLLEIPGRAY